MNNLEESDIIVEILKGDWKYIELAADPAERMWLIDAKKSDPEWWKRMTGDCPSDTEFDIRMNISVRY